MLRIPYLAGNGSCSRWARPAYLVYPHTVFIVWFTQMRGDDLLVSEQSLTIDPLSDALLIIDAQRAFGGVIPVPGVEAALANMRRALSAWREAGGHVILTQHVYAS